jgi:signal transduction histidine kinase
MRMVRVQVAEVSQEASSQLQDDDLRLLGRMAAGVVHDLNNYLAVIHANLTLFERMPGERDLLARALDGVSQAGRLTSTLLDHVRGQRQALEEVDFGALVNRTLALFERTLPSNIDLEVQIAPDLGPVRGAPTELEQLVLNLVMNAVDAMPEGGELLVRVLATDGASVYFEISDTGAGITVEAPTAPEAMAPSTKDGRRVGLGLGIVQRVVDRCGGALAIAPRRDGSGTTAVIFLPSA